MPDSSAAPQTVFAHTPPVAQPPFVNLSRRGDRFVLMVRTEGSEGVCGAVAQIHLSPHVLRELALRALDEVGIDQAPPLR